VKFKNYTPMVIGIKKACPYFFLHNSKSIPAPATEAQNARRYNQQFNKQKKIPLGLVWAFCAR